MIDEFAGCGCGSTSCSGNKKCENYCPPTQDWASLYLWDREKDGSIPKNAFLLMAVPSKQSDCSWEPVRVTTEDLRADIDNNCFGDVKANALAIGECICDECWTLLNGAKVNYYDDDNNLVDCITVPNLQGRTIVMPDPCNYFGHGLTAPGMCTGDAKHVQTGDEVGPVSLDAEIFIEFVIPFSNFETDNGTDQRLPHVDPPDGTNSNQDNGDNGTWSTETDSFYPIDARVDIENTNANAKPMNIMQPSYAMNYYMYICKDGLTHEVVQPSDEAKPECKKHVSTDVGNNGEDWWRP